MYEVKALRLAFRAEEQDRLTCPVMEQQFIGSHLVNKLLEKG